MMTTLEYKGYIGSVELQDDNTYYGKVLGIKALIAYEGATVEELIEDFHGAVDDYLSVCEAEDIEPETSCTETKKEICSTSEKGILTFTLDQELYKKAENILSELGVPMSVAIEMFIRQVVFHRGIPFEIKLPPWINIEDLSGYEEDTDAADKEESIDEVMTEVSSLNQDLDYFVNLPYKLVFEVDPYEGGYVISFPELRGCLSCAETIEDACKMAVDAKRTWFGAAAEEGIDIPAPVTFKTEKEIQEFKKRLNRLSATITKQRKSGENDGKDEKDSI